MLSQNRLCASSTMSACLPSKISGLRPTVLKMCALLGIFLGCGSLALGLTLTSAKTGVSVQLDETTGAYRVTATNPAWSFAGSLGVAASAVHTTEGQDGAGTYQQIEFNWQAGPAPMRGVIRLYRENPLVLFQYTYLQASSTPTVAFPRFTAIPDEPTPTQENLFHFSYAKTTRAPAQFLLGQYSTPWLLFDGKANAMVISPASNFFLASMQGDGINLMASGLNGKLDSVPAGFTQKTLMVIAPGIRNAWDIWGHGLTGISGKKRPGNESDVILKYLGYWTDNGATYYYKFDPKLGYAGTLEAVAAQYRKEKIPVHYMQLDSWWYDKAYDGMSPDDHTGKWDGHRGTMLYEANSQLFPNGLKAFQQSIGMPLAVHGRWISRNSPYMKNYNFVGLAPVDSRWWNKIADYMAANGVVMYEQDWNDYINYQSGFQRTLSTGDEFYGGMASSSNHHNITMQYCGGLPSSYLQGSLYSNLTTTRVSDDRFGRPRWQDFLYTSQLAYAVGAWPWTDVYLSHETDNILLSTLSAGPVGIGDALGAVNRTNIFKAVRADGVIVKPDVPIMPLDRMYVAGAEDTKMVAHGKSSDPPIPPMIGSAWTNENADGSLRTAYVFAFSRTGRVHETVHFTPKEAGSEGPAYVYDYFNHLVSRVGKGQEFQVEIAPEGVGYYVVAPIGPSGIALFGDKGKFVSMGRQRIASVTENPHSVTVEVLFAPGEDSIELFGAAAVKPTVSANKGSVGAVSFTKDNEMFSVRISPDNHVSAETVDGDPVRRVTVTFTES